jgi:hypothetical protein
LYEGSGFDKGSRVGFADPVGSACDYDGHAVDFAVVDWAGNVNWSAVRVWFHLGDQGLAKLEENAA